MGTAGLSVQELGVGKWFSPTWQSTDGKELCGLCMSQEGGPLKNPAAASWL